MIVFYIIAFFVGVVFFVLSLFLKQGPGAKNISKIAANRDVRGGLKIIFTERIFGFNDFGLFGRESSVREKVFFLIFAIVVVVAFFFF